MIVNTTTLNKNDLRVMCEDMAEQSVKTKKTRISRILLIVYGVILLGIGVYGSFFWDAGNRSADAAAAAHICFALAIVLGLLGICLAAFLKQIRAFRTMYSEEAAKLIDRKSTAVFNEDCVSVLHTSEGVFTETRYECAALKGYLVRENSVYIRVAEDGQPDYIVLHDDAYTEENKENLFALLAQWKIPQLTKG